MLGGIRAILYQTELMYPPLDELKVTKENIRSLYGKLCEPDGYPYDNIDLQSDRPTLSTRRGNGGSFCRFGRDMISIEEISPFDGSFGVDDFVEIVRKILAGLGSFPPVFIQRCRIEALAQPHTSKSSIDLLAGKVANVVDKINPFGRPPSYFGVRFRFVPPEVLALDDPEDEQLSEDEKAEAGASAIEGIDSSDESEHRGFMTLRLDTYSKDTKQVWMELAATFPDPLTSGNDMDEVARNIHDTYNFLAEKATGFLNQFDEDKGKGNMKAGETP